MSSILSPPGDISLAEKNGSKNGHDVVVSEVDSNSSESSKNTTVPLSAKLISVLLISLIGFGGHWSSGVTGAMKSTLKKQLKINNTQFSLLNNSEDLIKLLLIVLTGFYTDRFGGASTLVWGNAIFSLGSIFIASATTVRSFKFMIFGYVVQALGDVATQVAQYKVFSSWFPPNAGFASTLGLELGIGKIGSFVGKASANAIAKRTGNFAWVYWTAVFMNIFTNVITVLFWLYTRYANTKYKGMQDPATGEKLNEKNKISLKKCLELPWTFWLVILFTAFQTSTAVIFSANSTELAEQRFKVSSVTAGWYSAMSQYLGFFLVPCIGAFVDVLGNRVTLFAICGIGMLLSMTLVAWGDTISGTAASFGIYAIASSFGPTVIIDSIRTSLLHHGVFGTAYAVKILVNNSMNIILSVGCGVLQDKDKNSYDRVAVIYATDSALAVAVVIFMVVTCYSSRDMRMLQWSRKKRMANGQLLNERTTTGTTKLINYVFYGSVAVLSLGALCAYIWSAAVGYAY